MISGNVNRLEHAISCFPMQLHLVDQIGFVFFFFYGLDELPEIEC